MKTNHTAFLSKRSLSERSSSGRPHPALACSIGALLTCALLPSTARAAAYTWTNGASDATWNGASTDWTAGAGNIAWSDNNDVVFGATGAGAITVAGTQHIHSLTVNAAGYSLAGGQINLLNAATAFTVNNNLAIGSVLGGGGGLSTSGTGTLTLTGSNTYTGNTTVNAGTLAINSTGEIYSGGYNNSSTVTISNGAELQVAAWGYGLAGSIGDLDFGAAHLVVNGGTITYTGIGDNGGSSNARLFTVGVGGATLNAAGTGTWFLTNGSQTIGSGLTLNLTGPGNGEIDNSLTGGGALAKSGAGTWTLGGNNTFSGGTTVTGGTLVIKSAGAANNSVVNVGVNNGLAFGLNSATLGGLSGSGNVALLNGTNGVALTVGNSASTTYSGALSGSGGSLTKTGASTFTLSGSNSYTGNTTVSGGVLQFAASSAIPNNTVLNMTSGTALFTGAITNTFNFYNYNDVNGATYAIVLANGATWNSGAGNQIYLGNGGYNGSSFAIQVSANCVLNTTSSNLVLGQYDSNSTNALVNNGGTVSINGNLYLESQRSGTNTNLLTMTSGTTSAGTLYVGAGNTSSNTNTVSVSGGLLTVNYLPLYSSVGSTSSVVITGGFVQDSGNCDFSTSGTSSVTTNSITLGNGALGSGTLSVHQFNQLSPGANTTNQILWNGGVLKASNNNSTLISASGINMIVGGAGGVFDVNGFSSTIPAIISGTGGLVVANSSGTAGTLTLTGSNSYTGATTVNGGTLQLGNASALGTTTAALINNGAVNLGGYSVTVDAFSGSGAISNGSLTVGSANGSGVFSGSFSGAGGLTQSGSGTLTLTGSNSYTGATTITGGTLQIGNGGTTGSLSASSAVTLNGGCALTLNLAGSGTFGSYITTTGANGSAVVSVIGSGTTTFSSNITGPGGFNQSGSGTTIFSGNETYAGPTSIAGGTLVINSAGAANNSVVNVGVNNGLTFGVNSATLGGLSGSGNVALLNGTNGVALTVQSGVFSSAYSGALSGSGGSLTKTGAGTFTLSGSNSYTGNTTVSGGVLQFAASSAIPNNTVLNMTSGTAFFTGAITNTFNFYNFNDVSAATYAIVLANGATWNSGAGNPIYFGNGGYNGSSFTIQVGANCVLNTTSGGLVIGQYDTNSTNAVINNGGTVSVNGNLYLNSGRSGTNTNLLTMTSGTISAGTLYVGYGNTPSNTNTVSVSGGLLTVGSLPLYSSAGSISSVVITGGFVQDSGNSDFSTSGTSSVTTNSITLGNGAMGSGTLSVHQFNQLSPGANTTNQILWNGGVLKASNTNSTLIPASGIDVIVGGAGGVFDVNGFSSTIPAQISGTGGLVVANSSGTAGTLVLTGSNSYTGGTTLNAGTLSIASDNAIGGAASALTFQGGTLQLTGTGIANLDSHSVNWSTFSGGLDINSAANIFTVSEALSGTGSLTKLGAGTLTLSGSNSFSGATTVSSGTLILANSYALGNSTITIGTAPIAFDSSVSSHAFTVGGLAGSSNLALRDNAATPNPVAFTVGANNQSTSYSGVLSGSGSLIKTGTGTLILTVANKFSGPTGINGGVLQLNNSLANSTVTVGNNNDLTFGANSITLGGLSGSGNVALLNGTNGVALTVEGNGSSTAYSGALSGSGGSLTKTGAGTFTLSGSNSYTGNTTVGGGVLQFAASSAIPNNTLLSMTSGTALFTGAITNTFNFYNFNDVSAATYAIVLANGATWNNVGNQIYFGNGGYNGSSFTIQVGASCVLSTTSSDLILGQYDTNSTNALINNGGTVSINGIIDLLSQRSGTNTNLVTMTSGTTSATGKLYVGDGATANNTNTVSVSGGLLNVSGIQFNRSNGSTSSTNALIITGGAVNLTNNMDFGNSGASNFSNFNSLTLGNGALGSGTLSVNTFNNLYTTSSNTNQILWNGGVLKAKNANNNLIPASGINVIVGGAGGDFDVNGVSSTINAQMSGTGGFVVANSSGTAGTLILAGSNSYTGATTVNSGTLQLGNASALGTTTAALTDNGAVNLGGYSVTVDAFSGSGTVSNGSLTVGSANGSGVFSGSFSGTGGLTKNGSGTLTLTGTNTYTGATTVIGGALQLGNGGTTGSLSTSSALVDNATLVFNRSNTLTQGTNFAATISGSGNVVQAGAGTTVLTGSNSYSGGTTVSSGSLQVGNVNALGTGGLTVNGGALDLHGNNVSVPGFSGAGGNVTNTVGGTVAFTANISGASSYAGSIADGAGIVALTKSGAGTLALTGSNSYSGGTTVRSGTLAVSGSGTLGATTGGLTANGGVLDLGTTSQTVGAVTFAGGVVQNGGLTGTSFNGQSGTVSASLSGTGALSKTTAGTLAVTGSNSYSGGTTVSSGSLQIGNANALGTGGLTVNGGSLDLNGNSATVSAFSGAGGTVTNTVPGTSVLASVVSGTSTYAGNVMDGAGSVILDKQGTGELVLSGSIQMSGLTTEAGPVQLTQSGSVGTVTLYSGATVSMAAHSGSTYNVLNVSSLSVAGFSTSPSMAAKPAALNADALGSGAGNAMLTSAGQSQNSGAAANTEVPSEPASPEAVPEPGSLGLLVAGALGLLGLRRKAKRSVR